MSEKAAGFQEADKWLEGATRAAHEYRCRLREEINSEPHCYADNLMRVAHHIKGQRDELASIAGEMAGALNTTLNEIRINYGTPTREGFYCGDFGDEWAEQIDALSRYNKWAEKQQ